MAQMRVIFTRCHNMFRALAALGLMVAAGLAVAQAGPPVVTDDPGTPGDGKWEINLATIASKTYRRWDVDLFDADINYGLGDHIQLKLDVPWTYAKDSGSPSHTGLGGVNVGVKWRFIDNDETHGFALSTYPQFLSSWSQYSKRKGIAPANKEFYLPVELATTAGGFEIAAEAGHLFVQNEHDEWQAGVVVAHECVNENLECLFEVHQTVVPHNSQTLVNLAMRYKLSESLILLAAAGRDFGPSMPEQQRGLFYFGIQLLR